MQSERKKIQQEKKINTWSGMNFKPTKHPHGRGLQPTPNCSASRRVSALAAPAAPVAAASAAAR